MPKILAIILLALLSTPCVASEEISQAVDPRCVQFSEPFLYAAQVSVGRTLDQSLEIFERSRSKDPTKDDLIAEKWMLATIRFVYRHSELSPEELQQRVQASCSISPDGKIRFNGI
jgi:hypothetical protein